MENILIQENYTEPNEIVKDKVIFVPSQKKIFVESKIRYKFIDLGLSVKWASTNVGAKKPEESGYYFQWGDKQGYTLENKVFDCSTYKYIDENGAYTKYTGSDINILELEDDGAYNYNKNMRVPSYNELSELLNNTNSKWIVNYENSGVNGRLLTSKKNGQSIFLPAVGGVVGTEVSGFNSYGYILSNTLKSDNKNIWDVYFGANALAIGNISRCYGLSIRGVSDN